MEPLERHTFWIVSVRSGSNRRDFLFETKAGETPQDTYKRVKENAAKISSQLDISRVTVEIISRSIPFKPKGSPPHKSWYWCPYCNKWRVFNYDDTFAVNKCNICGISDQDFYVKKYNHIWAKEEIARKKIKK